MSTSDLDGRSLPGKPLHDILNLGRLAQLRVTARPDIEAVEVRARERGHPPVVILLAAAQALELAQRLVGAVLDVAAEGVEP